MYVILSENNIYKDTQDCFRITLVVVLVLYFVKIVEF